MLRRSRLVFALCLAAWPTAVHAQLVINTIAGGYIPNNVPSASASLAIVGLASGPSGALYVATTNAVYKIGAGGNLALYAGTGYYDPPRDGAQATQSPLISVLAIAVDSNENLYIWDAQGNSGQRLLRVIPTTGVMNAMQLPARANGFPPGVGAYSPGVGQNAFAIDNQGNFFIGGGAEVDEVTAGTVQRIAGTGTVGYYQGEGGPATQALLGGLLAVAVDPSGNVFIADPGNLRIYRVDHNTKVITTVAGGGPVASLCAESKPGNQIAISAPAFLAINSNGDVIFPDSYCYKVRKIDHTTGVVSTLVGTGSDGSSPDGTLATAAKITAGSAIGFPVLPDLRTGDLYLVDGVDNPFANPYYAGRVRKVAAANGQLVTIAGSGARSYSGDGNPANQAQLLGPQDVAVDGAGNIYIADSGNNHIRKIDGKTGLISTVAGTGNTNFNGDGPALTTNLSSPSGVAIDHNGNLLISDTGNSRVRKLANGAISTIAGPGKYTNFGDPVGDGGPALSAVLLQPTGLSVDPAGNIYVADTQDNKIRRIALDQTISTVAGSGGAATGSGYSGDGGPAINAQLSFPRGVALDPQGNLLIADSGNDCVRKVTFGTISAFAGVCAPSNVAYVGDGGPATSAHFELGRLAIDSTGNVFISTGNERILKVTSDGLITSIAGTFLAGNPAIGDCCSTFGYSGDGGPAALALLNGPSGLTFDNNGGLLIADAGNGMIRRLSVASQPTFTVDGVTNGASFKSGLVAGSIGTIFGTNLTTILGISSAGQVPLPLQLGGTSVQINGSSVPLFGVANVNGQQQINFQVPWELAGSQSVTVAVTNYGALSQPLTTPVLAAQPGIFTDGSGNAAALHGSTNQAITTNSPATKGEVIALYATGLGPVSGHPQDGAPSGSQTTTLQPTVTVGGFNAQVQYSGLAPGLVGGYQVNILVPAGLSSGTASVLITMNGVLSNTAKLIIQ